jgi:hypothetical protein
MERSPNKGLNILCFDPHELTEFGNGKWLMLLFFEMDLHLSVELPTIAITSANDQHHVFRINGYSPHVNFYTVSYTIHTSSMLYPYIIHMGSFVNWWMRIAFRLPDVLYKFKVTD